MIYGLVANTSSSSIDMQADTVVLRTTAATPTVRIQTSVPKITCDFTVASAGGGRDQAGAFVAGNWVHCYFVSTGGGTPVGLASLTAPPTGPTLPSSYVDWAYATAIKYNASTQVWQTHTNGNHVSYDVNDQTDNRVLSNGQSASFVAVDASGLIPPNCREVTLNVQAASTTGTIGSFPRVFTRPTGSTGAGMVSVEFEVVSTNVSLLETFTIINVSSSQAFDYKVDSTNSATWIDVHGYFVPNGSG